MPTPDTHQLRFDDLLFRALELPADEVPAFLERECKDDALRQRLLEALEADADSGTFPGALVAIEALDPTDHPEALIGTALLGRGGPAGGVASDSRGSRDGLEVVLGEQGALDRIGPYRILEPLGTGGMGRVFLAEQTEPVHRRLAIKLMRTSLVSRRSLARFSAERQAMARLSHPNIARLYDAGTTADGHPFFAMEWVDGSDLLSFCDRRSATLEERLLLFLDVCAAVHHAHLNQILHRDLKPSNILVAEIDGAASVRVIDFGIAKAMDDPLTAHTQLTGERLPGTPAYMSPEALAPGKPEPTADGSPSAATPGVDARTDVYSLGIVLYQLLTGTPPFEPDQSLAALLRQISEHDPPRPSRRLSSLSEATRSAVAGQRRIEPAELGRRLSGDLDWIVQKAIAKEPDQRYASVSELADDLRRHLRHEPVSAGPQTLAYRLKKLGRRHRTAMAFALVAVLALVVGIAGLGYGLVRARSEAEEARRASREAEAVAEFLADLFIASDSYGSDRRDGRSPEELTALDLLAEGRQRITEELADEPLVRARLVRVIGTVYKRMSRHDDARELFESSLELLRETEGLDSPRAAVVFQELGDLAYRERRLDDARELFGRSLELRQRHHGEAHRELIPPLAGLSRAALRLDRLGEASEHLSRALAVLEAQPPEGGEEGAWEDRDQTHASLLNSLGQLRRAENRPEEALRHWQQALDILTRLYGENHARVAILVDNVGIAHANLDRPDEAGSYFERALRIREATLQDDDPSLAVSYNNLAAHYQETGRVADAEPLHRRALGIREKAFGPDHPWVAWSLENLGVTLLDLGRTEEAAPLLQRSLEIRVASLGDDHRDVARSLDALSRVDAAAGDLESAERRLRRAIEIRRAKLAPDAPNLLSDLERLAELIERRDSDDPARRAEAAELREAASGAGAKVDDESSG